MFTVNPSLEHKTVNPPNDIALAYERLKEAGLSTDKNQSLLRHYAKYALDITLILEKLGQIKKELATQNNFYSLISYREFSQEILAALATTPITNQHDLDRLLYTIDRAQVFENLSDRPKDYITSHFFNCYGQFAVNPNQMAIYCYQKLNEAKPNGIAFSLPPEWENRELEAWHKLFNLWQEQHFLLVAFYTETEKWNQTVKEKTRDYIKNYVLEAKNPENFPLALIHNLRIKINIKIDQYEKSITLAQQSNLHVNLFQENYADAKLPGIQFAYANLTSIIFEKANLQNANLKGTILHHANLRGADLRGTDLEDAQLHNADLRETLLDEKSALSIIRFIENHPLYIPEKYLRLYQCILDAKQTDLFQRAQDCIALIFAIKLEGNFHLENFPEAMKDYPVSPAFLQTFLDITAPKAEPSDTINFCVTQVNEDCQRYDTYEGYETIVADEKIMAHKERETQYYFFFNEKKANDAKAHAQGMFTRAYTVQSRYLVIEFHHNKKLIWDRSAPKESPLVSLSYLEEEKDPLLPLYRIVQKPYSRIYSQKKPFLDAASLHPDEVVALHLDEEQFSLKFFKEEKLVKSYKLDKPATCASLTSPHPDQFVVAYFDNTIEVWNRKIAEDDSIDFSPISHFFVEPINRPFCPEKIDTLEQHTQHRCFKLIRSYNQDTYSFVTHSILISQPNESSVRALNSEEILYIQDNYKYQFLVRINIKTQEMTHALEFSQGLSSWKTVPHTYYPLADGVTFLVGTYQIGNGHKSGSALILDAKTMSFYKTDGIKFSEESAELAILESSEVLKVNIKRNRRDQESVYIEKPFPHITAHLEKRKSYIDNQVDDNLQMMNHNLRQIVKEYLDGNMTLSLEEKNKIAVNPAEFYGNPVAVFSKLPLECHPHDYFCRGTQPPYYEPDNSLEIFFGNRTEDKSAEESKPVSVANNPSGLFAGANVKPENGNRICCDCTIL